MRKSGHSSGRPGPSQIASRTNAGRRELGRLGEELAAAHLGRLGFSVLARNTRSRQGEIDLIAFDGQVMVFAEVKTRRAIPGAHRTCAHEEPLAALRPRQRARLRKLAVAWLADAGRLRPSARIIRFDGLGVTVDGADRLVRIDHVEGAW
jgi:putative endonuclease